jgi:hypothetical protein
MKWSYSAARTFDLCRRKWYFEKFYADRKVQDKERNRAFFLKRLQSVHAWRGKLVDDVITRFIVPRLKNGQGIELENVLSYANSLIATQLNERRNLTSANCNGFFEKPQDMHPFFEVEYGAGLSDSAILTATHEINTSLKNLLNSKLFAEIQEGCELLAQRRLQFRFANASVSCTPDLIVFPDEASPRIVDWKVQAPVNKEHRLQLAVYALALSKAKPHKDFPEMWREKPIDSLGIGLMEFQLLRNREQNYVLTTDDLIDVEDYIFRTSRAMSAAVDGNPSPPSADLFRSTYFPSFCTHCKFRKICWKEVAS